MPPAKSPHLPGATALLDALPEPAVLLGLDHRILAANRAYRERYGAIPPQARCYQVSHRYAQPCDLAGESCPLQASLEAGQPRRVLHLHYTRHGEEHVDVETFPVREGGRVVAVLEVLHHGTVGAARPQGGPLLGRSPPFNRMLGLIERVAPSEVPVLLLGESGTSLAARAVHQASRRAQGPFVPLDCSGLSETLFESELFGHEKGAFTGALGRKTGLVEAASGGTLSWTRWGTSPCPCRSSSCACWRRAPFAGWGAWRSSRPTSAWSAPPTETWRPWCGRGPSAGTSTTGSPPSPSASRPCASAGRTCPCWPRPSWPA